MADSDLAERPLMAAWGVCTTLNATEDEVLAFVAHHLDLGATHIWLHFDDPESDAARIAEHLPRTTAVRCDEAYWRDLCGRRPGEHQNRQSRNIQRVCRHAAIPWVAHIDNDEFLVADRGVEDILNEVPSAQLMLRVAPFEALSEPGLPDDIFTARAFRGPLRGPSQHVARERLFGRYASVVPDGVLSHTAGKCFFRTGIKRLEPRIHGAFFARARAPSGAFHPDMALLHFHAQDFNRWADRLQFRLQKGCYRTRPELYAHLVACDTADLKTFHTAVQGVTPEGLDLSQRLGILRKETLGLRRKVATLTEGLCI